ncbi:glycosyltransferase [Pseudomonas seleniipraecipitans]|uniref:Glycosyltransferase n=1 Tax=Phytopseudomonas seleniipraecipitans TaxID=640205 RepID=A0ABY5JC56_9GAMM|nr:glycosyltransferase [Pseudomonas seleniipraecipitans]UUD65611.1 glycosyltransferase [Pseudomonas seleniipraecipitans]
MTAPIKPVIQEPATLATVTVTFNPSQPELFAQLNALPTCSIKVIVDNASQPQYLAEIESLAHHFPNVFLIRSEVNLGLAAAVNRGAQWLTILESKPEFLLLLDQDSEPRLGSIEALVLGFKSLQAAGNKVGCVGPLLEDPDTDLTHGFHQSTRLRWTRTYPQPGSLSPVRCANLNGSGTLLPLALFEQLRGLDESLFIDHVDTEWSFRVMAHGYELWGIPKAIFKHSMGQKSTRFWLFGWRVWPVRSPQRHYYLYRNAITLMKRSYIPTVWKTWAFAKLLLTASVTAIMGPLRGQQLAHMCKGIKKGLGENAK